MSAPVAGTYTIETHDGKGHTGVSDPIPYDATASVHDAALKQAVERVNAAALEAFR